MPNVLWYDFDSQGSNHKYNFSICFYSVQMCSVIKKAMEVKLCLVLMLLILGTLAIQGGIPRNNKKNPLEVFARQPRECFFDP